MREPVVRQHGSDRDRAGKPTRADGSHYAIGKTETKTETEPEPLPQSVAYV